MSTVPKDSWTLSQGVERWQMDFGGKRAHQSHFCLCLSQLLDTMQQMMQNWSDTFKDYFVNEGAVEWQSNMIWTWLKIKAQQFEFVAMCEAA